MNGYIVKNNLYHELPIQKQDGSVVILEPRTEEGRSTFIPVDMAVKSQLNHLKKFNIIGIRKAKKG